MDNSYPRQLVPKTIRTQDNSYPRRLIPKTTRTQDNSYPRRLVPRTTRTQDDSYPSKFVPRTSCMVLFNITCNFTVGQIKTSFKSSHLVLTIISQNVLIPSSSTKEHFDFVHTKCRYTIGQLTISQVGRRGPQAPPWWQNSNGTQRSLWLPGLWKHVLPSAKIPPRGSFGPI